MPQGKAIRYGIAVGEDAQAWSGIAKVGRMEEWPGWVPDPERADPAWTVAGLCDRRPA